VARALLLRGAQQPLRVLCAREFQKSIEGSVHKLLCDQIQALGLGHLYQTEVGKIKGPGDTVFSFEGIKNNATKIKSYEGVDICWVEEANAVTATSWGILLPTIRKDGSEIWITFNPELATDYTYKRFVLNPSGTVLARTQTAAGNPVVETDESFIVKMTWADNPWFPEVLRKEMEDLRLRDPDAWSNIWEGNCRQALEGAVFAKELRDVVNSGRLTVVPWSRETPVDTFWDLGRRDQTSIWFAQRVGMQWRMLAYFEDTSEDIHYYLRHCQSRTYTYGTFYLPHDAKNKLLGAKRSIEQIVRDSGRSVRIVERTRKKVNAINAARIIFPTCWFDERECAEGIERLRHYRYDMKDGQRSEEPLHDENSNGADAFMTLAQAIRGPVGSRSIANKLSPPRRRGEANDPAAGLQWMGR
jgi:phage terminase large subunit